MKILQFDAILHFFINFPLKMLHPTMENRTMGTIKVAKKKRIIDFFTSLSIEPHTLNLTTNCFNFTYLFS